MGYNEGDLASRLYVEHLKHYNMYFDKKIMFREDNTRIEEYIKNLGDALFKEYKDYGKSFLVNSLYHSNEDVDVATGEGIVYAIELIDKGIASLNKNMTGLNNYGQYKLDSRKRRSVISYDFVREMLTALNKDGQVLNLYYAKEKSNTRNPEQGSNDISYNQDYGKNGTKEVQNAAVPNPQLREKIRAEEQEKLKDLKQQILQDAEKERNEIINRAEADRNNILENARKEAAEIRSDAEKEKNRIIEEANRVAEEEMQDLVKKYLQKNRQEFKSSLNSDIRALIHEENKAYLGKTDALHEDMVDTTNKLQRSWTENLNGMNSTLQESWTSELDAMIENLKSAWTEELGKTVTELDKIKREYYDKTRQWQRELYAIEHKPIADQFISLYNLINVDKIITREMEKIAETSKNDEAKTDPQPVIDSLMKLNENLTRFLKNFEKSLKSLSLYAYYPEQGEPFDDIWHTPADEDSFDPALENKVKDCIVPGIAKKMSDEEDDVIIPAVVSV